MHPSLQLALTIGTLYLAFGIAFAFPFVLRGVGRIDPAADHSSWSFRAMILPGVAALWPLLLRRWLSASSQPPAERSPDQAERRP